MNQVPASFDTALKLLLAILLVPSFATGAHAADWRIPGVYAYDSRDWESHVEKKFPLIVVRYHIGQEVAPQVRTIRNLAASGNRVIVNFEFMQNIEQRRSRASLPPFDKIKPKLLAMLDGLGDTQVEAISLDEENNLGSDKIEYLNRLYQVAKDHSPHHKIVQWVVFRKQGGHVQFQGLGSLAADGWVIDPYLSSEKDYSTIVDALTKTSKPIYSVVWASPGWQVSAGYRIHAEQDWWNGSQWKTLYNRLAVNQKSNISTIFYIFGLKNKNVASLWASNSCDRKFFEDIVNITLPYFQENYIPLTTPASRPKWIPTYCG